MFVEKMTLQEIRDEFEKEYQSVEFKVIAYAKMLRQEMKRNFKGKYSQGKFTKEFKFTSTRNNKWTITISMDQLSAIVNRWCEYNTSKGFIVISQLDGDDYGKKKIPYTHSIIMFTGHFFKRYFERTEADKAVNLEKRIKQFHKANFTTSIKELDSDNPDVCEVFIQQNEGVALGTLHKKFDIYELKTFINNEMLMGNQVQISEDLDHYDRNMQDVFKSKAFFMPLHKYLSKKRY